MKSVARHARHVSAYTRRPFRLAQRSRALARAILEILEPRTLLSGLEFSGGFSNNGDITLNGPANISGSQLQLSGTSASAWSTVPQDITQFSTQFSFQSTGSPGKFTFTLQANCNTAAGGGLDHTVALTFDLAHGNVDPLVNGILDPNQPHTVTGLNFNNSDVFDVTLTYPYFPSFSGASSTLRFTITDTNSSASFTNEYYAFDIPAVLNGGAAFVGFTGGTGAQNLSTWTYSSPDIGMKPLAPSYLSSALYPSQINLAWTDNSTNEDGFVIERAPRTGGTPVFSDLATVSANVTSYTDHAIVPGDSYWYRVRAFNSSGSSVASDPISGVSDALPLTPTNATATAVSPNEVNLNWQIINTEHTQGFRIYRKATGDPDFTLIGMVAAGYPDIFADKNAPSGATLDYHIVAYKYISDYSPLGESGFADAAATTPSTGVDALAPAITLNGSARMAGSNLQLTDGQSGAEAGSAFSSGLQDAYQFTTQFSFQISHPDVGGFTFTFQDNSDSAVGNATVASLGYDGISGYNRPIAMQFLINASGGSATGFYLNPIDVGPSGIDFRSGHTFQVSLAYDHHIGAAGALLHETIVDTTTGATFQHADWLLFFPWTGLDYVGFTGSKGASSQQSVNINSWSYSTNDQTHPSTTFLAANSAPVLTGANDFPTITEDFHGGAGMYAGQILGTFSPALNPYWSDVDLADRDASGSIAIIGQNPGNGTWRYYGPAGWTDIGAVSDTSALLIDNETQLAFFPDGKNGTTASLTLRAWDESNGLDLQFSKVDTSVNGGTTPYSAQTATTHITVTDVNDAPFFLWDADNPTVTTPRPFPSITEDQTSNQGITVGDLIASEVIDYDLNAPAPGIAVVGQDFNFNTGIWQYSLDSGGTWISFGLLSQTSATLLGPDARVRLLPNGQYGTRSTPEGPAGLMITAWDRTDPRYNSGDTNADARHTGPTSTFGGAATPTIFVADINDAPVLNGVDDFPTIRADYLDNPGTLPEGLNVLMAGHEDDVDLDAPYTGNIYNEHAVAIVGQNPGNGTWQFNTGGPWTNISAVSNTSALLLSGDTPVRFVPNGHDGTFASLTLRAWDASNGIDLYYSKVDTSINGGSTPYSAQTATTHITVTPTIVTSALSLAPAIGIYGGTTSLSATLQAGGAPLFGQLITFTRADNSPLGTATTNASGIATLPNISLAGLDAATYLNAYHANFAGNGNFTPSSAAASLVVNPAPIQVVYTGSTLITASSTGSASVSLRADLKDNTNGTGDIRNATVTFLIYDAGSNVLLATIPASAVGLLNPSDIKTGSATATWTTNLGTAAAKTFKVAIQVTHDYTGGTTASPDLFTISSPSSGKTTGGGYLVEASSAGTYAADTGTKTDFGFIASDTSGTPSGNINIIFRRTAADGTLHTYQIQSTAILSYGQDSADTRAVILASATLTDLTQSALLGQALTLQLSLTDAGEPATNDSLAITLWNSTTLLFSSDWSGLQTLQQTLAGGNLQIH